MSKILFVDVETTGLKPEVHDIIEIGYIIEIDGSIKESGSLNMQPYSYENIDHEALKISNHTVEKLRTYPAPEIAYKAFVSVLGKYCNKYNPSDKFFPSGFNCRFDLEFLNQFFLRNGDKYFGSWQNWRMIDPRPVLLFLGFIGKISLDKYSLDEACKYFNISIESHSAISDIKATRELVYILKDLLMGTTNRGIAPEEEECLKSS